VKSMRSGWKKSTGTGIPVRTGIPGRN